MGIEPQGRSVERDSQMTAVKAEFHSLREYLAEILSLEERRSIGLIGFNQWSFALGAISEIALAAQALDSRVTIGLWAGKTPLRDTGWTTSRAWARLLRDSTMDQRAELALRKAGLPDECFVDPPIRRWRPHSLLDLPHPLTRSRIRALSYRGSDMGRSILQVHPDSNTPINESHVWPQRWIRRAMRSYAWAYDQTEALIRARSLKTIVVYNGRFTHDRAVAAAASAAGVRVLYYDTGGYDTDFDLTDATTHDWADLQRRMLRMYDAWDPEERDAIGSQWFTSRQTHTDSRNKLFVGAQTRGHVEGMPDSETTVAFFSSSGDEIAELDLDWSEYLNSQEEALAALAEVCRRRPGTALVVRTHPHMRLKPERDLADWMDAVDSAEPTVHFDPSSSVDSYAVMAKADIVFTYGSTSGVEAAFLGKPVAVMGPSAYDLLGCAQRITRVDEISRVLDTPPVPHPEKAIPYGLMMQRRGFAFERLNKAGTGVTALEGVPYSESSPRVQKLSDLTRRAWTRWLTRA